MDKQDLRDLLRKEYENGVGITELCRKYNQSINTVKSWRKRDGWKKKQINAPLTNAPPKKKTAPPKQKGANEKEIQIKTDIINNVPKEEILEKIDDFIVYPGLGDEAGFVGSIALGKVALENSKK